jgi:hypothetical protein
MRFFTPDLLARFGSEDDQVADVAQEEVDIRTEEYVRALHEIAPKLPPRFRDLLEQFYLHDARVISQQGFVPNDLESIENSLRVGTPLTWSNPGAENHRTPSFWLHLQLDLPPGEILVLQYRSVLFEHAEVHESLIEECPYLEWLHDEVELVQSDECTEFRHSILFTRGLELRLRFKDFDFATLKPMEPAEELVGLCPSRRGG